MARHGLSVIVCAGVVLGALPPLPAAPREDHLKARVDSQLAVQAALEQGLARLQVGDYRSAVEILEKEISRVDGNHRYLTALRDAYRGRIAELRAAHRDDEAKPYVERLGILDPPVRVPAGAPLPPPPPASPTPAPAVAAPSVPPVPAALAPLAPPGRAPEALPERPPAAPRPRVAVGKAEDDDPFSDTNSVAFRRAKELVERAERAFDAKQYELAHRLYEQANRAVPCVTAACEGRWAYCKLHAVTQALNRPGSDAPTEELEREVRLALQMSPQMDPAAKRLLDRLRRRDGADRIEVKHSPRQGGGWARAETTNFRIFHATSPETAERAARVAEATRLAMTRKWFGEAPATWSPRCDIYLHSTAQDYSKATGAPAQTPGHSTISREGGRILRRRVDLHCDDPNMLTGVLPHETTHVILAGRFGSHDVPRWADEGMAVLSEPRERIELHLKNLPMHRREGTLFGVGQLMRMSDYPEPRFVGPFYAQSVALVEFLSRRKDGATFTRFLRDGLDGGYEPALRKHYGINGFAELQRLWDEHAFGAGVAAASENRR